MNFNQSIFQSIVEKYNLGDVRVSMPISGGIINKCFGVNDTHVVRFNEIDAGLSKFAAEKQSIEKTQAGSPEIPLPKIVAVDSVLCDLEFSLAEKLNGESLREWWTDLNSERKSELTYTSGIYLAKIHSIIAKEAGYTWESTRNESWKNYLDDSISDMLRNLVAQSVLTQEQANSMHTKVGNKIQEIPESQIVLMHGDYHPGNILTDGQVITGVLDFEWSRGGTAGYDLVDLNSIVGDGNTMMFKDGYESISPFPKLSKNERLLYSVHQNLTLLISCERRGDKWTEGSIWKQRALCNLSKIMTGTFCELCSSCQTCSTVEHTGEQT